MRARGMTSAYARRRFKLRRTRANEAKLANLLDREFDGYAPHTHLASGLTYVRVGGGWAYVCLPVDLANGGGIAGHSVGRTRGCLIVCVWVIILEGLNDGDLEERRCGRGPRRWCRGGFRPGARTG